MSQYLDLVDPTMWLMQLVLDEYLKSAMPSKDRLLGLCFSKVLRFAIFELDRFNASSACLRESFCSGLADLCLTPYTFRSIVYWPVNTLSKFSAPALIFSSTSNC